MTQNIERKRTRGLPIVMVAVGIACLAYAVWFHEVKVQPAPSPTATAGTEQQAEPATVKEPVLVEQVTHGLATPSTTGTIEVAPVTDPEVLCPT